MRKASTLYGDIHEAAAYWYARMSSDVKLPDDQAAFDGWISQRPEHAEAYAEACATAASFAALTGHPEVEALRVEALLLEEQRRRPLLARIGSMGTAAGLMAAAAAFLFYLLSVPTETGVWQTAPGQTRQIALSDGSTVVLGSDSRLEIRFRRTGRDLEIGRGQAYFDVAHDSTRPFVVAADGRRVTALGTAFDVRSYPNDTTVTLVRGRVEIAREDGSREALLMPGQQFRAASGGTSVRDVDGVAETSWRVGRLEFQNISLVDAVTEFNRSAPQSIVIADTRLADLRLSGVFRADDAYGFAMALVPAYPITATRQSSGDIVLRYRDGARSGGSAGR
ncbi:FecR family protein [Rhizorhabdus dicambivorans]|uniref:Iron dicitrate transport regulator FecR n=1 Tax=Rhizorhabdus dicambivorans TaxID=1850238 RepID=A0A2A4FVP1_9SPHN|nr:FecR domain-containing protein [Rhizorhabdus dicambivorans]ATE66873.1 hypothetical protein CMV14_22695 [Rhizorhabdus dicambivorans]PCE42259.1 hypothetical protein COO09_11595 [Rhizorhabdus dicambivorans]